MFTSEVTVKTLTVFNLFTRHCYRAEDTTTDKSKPLFFWGYVLEKEHTNKHVYPLDAYESSKEKEAGVCEGGGRYILGDQSRPPR